jgi:glycerophosphoryl diester phosphodiesterase
MIVLGHRGGRGEGWPPENTLPAFERALAEGADGVELDVRLCGSGDTALLHDPTLARITGGADKRELHRVRAADLPNLDGGVRIPSLPDALDLCHGRIVNVEVKVDVPRRMALVRAVIRALDRTGARDVVVSSFDPLVVLAFAIAKPQLPVAILVGPRTPRLGSALPLALRRFIVAAHLEDAILTAARAAQLAAVGLRVVGWTVNDPARATALARQGVDWLITDRPAVVVDALGRGMLAS